MAVETTVLGPQHLVAHSDGSLALVPFQQLETSSGCPEPAGVVGFLKRCVLVEHLLVVVFL